MTFKEEIEPYINHITLALNKQCALTSRVLNPIRDIYYKYIDDSKPINMGCNSCLRNILRIVLNKYNQEETKAVKMSFPKQVDYNSMKWGEFRKYCKSIGIVNINKKNREELINELSKL